MKGQFRLLFWLRLEKNPRAVLSKQNHSCFIPGHSPKNNTQGNAPGPLGWVGNRHHLEIRSQKKAHLRAAGSRGISSGGVSGGLSGEWGLHPEVSPRADPGAG